MPDVAFTEQQFAALLEGIAQMAATTANALHPEPAAPREKLKVEKPPTYEGEVGELRTFLVQCQLYFDATEETEDRKKIAYIKSLLRGSAAKWIVPYVENRTPMPWTTYGEFVAALKEQFGEKDAEGKARTKLENMHQGTDSVTEYWNLFRLTGTEANADEGTLKRMFLKGLGTKMQDAWGVDNETHDTVQMMADWAIRKECKLATLRNIQGKGSPHTANTSKTTPPRRDNGTFRPLTTTQGGEAMDLDATSRRRFNRLPNEEFKRRIKEGLCFKCGKKGHAARDCQVRQVKIREIQIEPGQKETETLNDGSLPE